ncbi:DUF6153 family protein [Streptomyces sp. NPDC016845]|uniref:DUF6153 family protein n=1 Tax=Streptomyces sp. NPDC016845 TaxID=3364972 RepID=UPI0037A6EB68
MSRALQPPSRRSAGRGVVLLVLAVLAGVLAMHGLAPGPTRAMASMGAMAGSGHGAVMPHKTAVAATGGCAHGAGFSHDTDGSGHAHHADAMCAAAGVAAPYTPPPPASVAAVPLPAHLLSAAAPGAPVGGRAPPDLAELQLLRI